MTNKAMVALYKIQNNMEVDEPLYTYAVWRKMGYIVKKGEKCNHKLQLWKHTEKTKTVDNEEIRTNKCFMKTVYLFTKEQVEKVEE